MSAYRLIFTVSIVLLITISFQVNPKSTFENSKVPSGFDKKTDDIEDFKYYGGAVTSGLDKKIDDDGSLRVRVSDSGCCECICIIN
ncbi:hypothetical protein CASFOL_041463 [Castilleja foliolosa]|uniref:Uncharacterized protein n=1 Tax=Castilleja foliolosa TaxID=1961234 RepID=A0ABD3BBF6_9LAMI